MFTRSFHLVWSAVLGFAQQQFGNTLYGIKWWTERADIAAYKSNIPNARGRNTTRGCRSGEEEAARNNSPRAGTRVSYRFLRAGRTGIGQLACGQPLCPQRCVGRASPATVLTPSPDVLCQYRRPQSPRSMGARGPRASPPRSAIYLITFPSYLSSAVVLTTVISIVNHNQPRYF